MSLTVSERERLADEAIAAAFAEPPVRHPLPSRAAIAPEPAPEPVSAELSAFAASHGYPQDAPRQPAGEYELLMAWSEPNPAAPDGVTPHDKGRRLQLTEEQATRLVHIGAAVPADEAERHRVSRLDGQRAHLEALQAELEADQQAMDAALAKADQEAAVANEAATVRRIAQLEDELTKLRSQR